MKSLSIYRLRNLLLAVAALCLLGRFNASANLLTALPEIGDLERWAEFSLGNTTLPNDHSGGSQIQGDVGVAGSGNINMSGSTTINGDLYYRTNGTLHLSGGAEITGMRHHDASSDSILDNGVNEANNTSIDAATFMSSTAYAGLTNIMLSGHGSLTLTAQHDRPGNTTVLNLQNLSLSGSSTLTLQGTATDNFIINVSKGFSLSGSSSIVLTGGIQWDDVLFNVTGTGSTVDISGSSNIMSGIVMATQRKVNLSGSTIVRGEVVANQFVLSGSAQVIHPAITSP